MPLNRISSHRILQIRCGLAQNSNSSTALGEYRRPPLYIQYEKRYVKYWFKLLMTPESLLLHSSYKIQLQLDKLYNRGWVADLEQLPFSNGFGHVRISQEAGNKALFLREYNLRLQEIARNWQINLES